MRVVVGRRKISKKQLKEKGSLVTNTHSQNEKLWVVKQKFQRITTTGMKIENVLTHEESSLLF
jgi:hypothetical protein